MLPKIIEVRNIKIGGNLPFVLIAGPCQIENLSHSKMIAEQLSELSDYLDIKFIFKGSFDKANRTSIDTKRGVGIDEGLTILDKVASEFNCPVLTDVHETNQCKPVSEVVDIIQIPAFLCRQTNLLLAAGETGKVINVKKGQFLAPQDMNHVAKKISSTGNTNIMLCDRGTSFGYNTLVSDFRSIPIMAETGYPVVFDATHSVQQPGANNGSSGGQRQYVPILAKAACAVGISALFIETHQDPDSAPSDGLNMIPISQMKTLLSKLKKIDALIKLTT
jgi:2-dehydro-3-deoxyphosphooctonate aldolase (KDO 8-P synthase)